VNLYDGYKFKCLSTSPATEQLERGVHLFTVQETVSGSLWIGCEEFLDKFDPLTTPLLTTRIERDAQAKQFPYNMRQDHTGMLWLSTVRALSDSIPRTDESSAIVTIQTTSQA